MYKGRGGVKVCEMIRDTFYKSGRWDEGDNIMIYRMANPDDLGNIWKSFNHVAIFQADAPPLHVYFETLPDGTTVAKEAYVATSVSALDLADLLQADEELEALGDETPVSDMQFVLEAALSNPTLHEAIESMPCWKAFRNALAHIDPEEEIDVFVPYTIKHGAAERNSIDEQLELLKEDGAAERSTSSPTV